MLSVDVPTHHVGPGPPRGQCAMKATGLIPLLHGEQLQLANLAGLGREGNQMLFTQNQGTAASPEVCGGGQRPRLWSLHPRLGQGIGPWTTSQ